MILYLFRATLLLLVFSALYHFVLSNKNTFRFNRWYLLLTLIGSFLFPLIPFNMLFETANVFQNISVAQPVLLNEIVVDLTSKNVNDSFNWTSFFEICFWTGFGLVLLRFLNELRKLWRLYKKAEKVIYDNKIVCIIEQENQIFTFGTIVFVNRTLFKNLKDHNAIWLHEKTHANQLHSIDVLVIELMKILFWFHPLVYLFEQNIKMNHEYLADEAALKQTQNVKTYQYELLDYLENTNTSLASSFNFKLTQKRFIMMKNKTNKWTEIVAKAVVVFGIIATITFVACSQDEIINQDIPENVQAKTEEKPLKFVEQKALPIEGLLKFYQNFARTFNAPDMGEGVNEIKVRLKFIVEKDGSFSNIEAVGSENENVSNEAIRVLKQMPNWKPAKHEGKIVRSSFTLPIKIKVNS